MTKIYKPVEQQCGKNSAQSLIFSFWTGYLQKRKKNKNKTQPTIKNTTLGLNVIKYYLNI